MEIFSIIGKVIFVYFYDELALILIISTINMFRVIFLNSCVKVWVINHRREKIFKFNYYHRPKINSWESMFNNFTPLLKNLPIKNEIAIVYCNSNLWALKLKLSLPNMKPKSTMLSSILL